MTAIVLMQLVNVFLCRSRRGSAFTQPLIGNRLLLSGVVAELLLILLIDYTRAGQALFGTAPIGLAAWLVVVPFALTMLIAEEARKAIVRVREQRASVMPRQPPRGASVSVRGYGLAVLGVAAAVEIRLGLQPWFGEDVPFLLFFPAILIAAWYGGRGSGTVATALSALAATYFFLPPSGFAVGEGADLLSLGIFLVIGLAIVGLNHQLQTTAVLASSRAEQLGTIINTTVDGIIVIDTEGKIEAFNRGAERLFGYPQSEVLGRNVSMLMPAPNHEEHDSYLKA